MLRKVTSTIPKGNSPTRPKTKKDQRPKIQKKRGNDQLERRHVVSGIITSLGHQKGQRKKWAEKSPTVGGGSKLMANKKKKTEIGHKQTKKASGHQKKENQGKKGGGRTCILWFVRGVLF